MTKSEFIRYIESTQEWLRRFLAGLCCGDMFLVDDLAQETYIKAYLSIESCKDRNKLKPWLLKIAYNNFLNHVRSRHQETGLDNINSTASENTADSRFRHEDLYIWP